MHPLSRRAFLATLAAAVPATALVRAAHAAAIDDLAADPRTLRSLGEAVLPSELGSTGVASAVADFQRWISSYRENAELLHGYGTSALTRTGPTPATRWMRQLDTLNDTARRSGARSFAALPLEQRRAIVRAELDSIKGNGLPPVGTAPHVALALLSHWYAGAHATDLCYQSQIMKQTCRPLSAQTRKPLPLAGGRS